MINQQSIYGFLEDDLGIDVSDIQSDTLLFSSGIIDSFALVNLMMLIEDEGGFKINNADVNLDNLDSVDRILSFVERCVA